MSIRHFRSKFLIEIFNGNFQLKTGVLIQKISKFAKQKSNKICGIKINQTFYKLSKQNVVKNL